MLVLLNNRSRVCPINFWLDGSSWYWGAAIHGAEAGLTTVIVNSYATVVGSAAVLMCVHGQGGGAYS